jgi:hypothetical protein
LNVDRDVARLRVALDHSDTARAARDAALDTLDPADTITEWLDGGEGFRWEVLGRASGLASLRDRLQDVVGGHGTVDWQGELTCLSLAGGRPDSWLEVERHVGQVLQEAGVTSWRLRADGSALRVLVPGSVPESLPANLHRALLPD